MDFTGKKLHCNYLYTISSGITKKNSCLINIASVGGNPDFSIMVLATAVFAMVNGVLSQNMLRRRGGCQPS